MSPYVLPGTLYRALVLRSRRLFEELILNGSKKLNVITKYRIINIRYDRAFFLKFDRMLDMNSISSLSDYIAIDLVRRTNRPGLLSSYLDKYLQIGSHLIIISNRLEDIAVQQEEK